MSARPPVTVTAHRTVRATPQQLFDTLVDSKRLARVRGVAEVRVMREGAAGPMSAGTRRRVRLHGGLFLVEEFVALEAPHTFDYRLLEASAPLDHRSGRVSFTAADDGTHASWTSTYDLPVPVVGGVVSRLSRPFVHVAFAVALSALDEQARRDERTTRLSD